MKTLNGIVQGTPAWLAVRAQHLCASDAAAAMGVSKYKDRSTLLREKSTGYTAEVDAATQRRFDSGHAAERDARSLAELAIGQELYPCVGTEMVDDMQLLASFDGATMDDSIIWETKLWNEELVAAVGAGELEPHYWAQMEHQLLVSGAKVAYFTCTDGTVGHYVSMWYESIPARRAQVIAAWKQFAIDLAAYQPVEVLPAAVATPQPSLPALMLRVDGALSIVSNLPTMAVALRAYIERIPAVPASDQEFADCDAACKTLKNFEDALDAGENSALAQIVDVEQMRRQKKDLYTLSRTTRLALEKLVEAQKKNIKVRIQQAAVKECAEFTEALNQTIGRPYMPAVPIDIPGAMARLKTVDSMRNAVNTAVANWKIACNDVCGRILVNMRTLRELAADHPGLFPDTATIVLKQPDDLTALVKTRIADHLEAEERKREALMHHRQREEQEALEARQREQAAATARAAEAQATQVAKTVPAAPTAFVQACRPEDRAMLDTQAGKALLAGAEVIFKTPEDVALLPADTWSAARDRIVTLLETLHIHELQELEQFIKRQWRKAA